MVHPWHSVLVAQPWKRREPDNLRNTVFPGCQGGGTIRHAQRLELDETWVWATGETDLQAQNSSLNNCVTLETASTALRSLSYREHIAIEHRLRCGSNKVVSKEGLGTSEQAL